MKILKKIQGFVTNSSSANYWLNDGVLEESELPNETPKSLDKYRLEYYEEKASAEQALNLAQEKKETLSDLLLWAAFSLILLIVFLLKKFKNDKTT